MSPFKSRIVFPANDVHLPTPENLHFCDIAQAGRGFFRERVSDIYDLKRRLLTELVGE